MIDKQLKQALEQFLSCHYITSKQPQVLRSVAPTNASESQSPSTESNQPAKQIASPPAPPYKNTSATQNNTLPPAKIDIFQQLKLFLTKNFSSHNARPTFASQLISIIKEQGLSEPAVYKAANIDRKLFSKIRQPHYHPSKNTALALVIALKLNISQAENLLRLAGYTLSNSSKTDVIIMFCLENKVYDIMLVNELLQEYTGKTL